MGSPSAVSFRAAALSSRPAFGRIEITTDALHNTQTPTVKMLSLFGPTESAEVSVPPDDALVVGGRVIATGDGIQALTERLMTTDMPKNGERVIELIVAALQPDRLKLASDDMLDTKVMPSGRRRSATTQDGDSNATMAMNAEGNAPVFIDGSATVHWFQAAIAGGDESAIARHLKSTPHVSLDLLTNILRYGRVE